MTDEYLAGFFDGEGSIGIYATSNGRKTESGNKIYWSIKVAIAVTYRPVIEAVYSYLGIGKFTTSKRQSIKRTPRGDYDSNGALCKQGWVWFATSKDDVRGFIVRIIPYLYEKKEQCQIVLDWLDGKLGGYEASVLCKEAKRHSFPADDFQEAKRRLPGFAGERNPAARLSNATAAKIRQLASDGERQVDLVREFGVSKQVINRLVLGKTYNCAANIS